MIEIALVLLLSPYCVYLGVRLGTWAYLTSKEQFNQFHNHERKDDDNQST